MPKSAMPVELRTRTAETVSIYFKKANTPAIRAVLPQKAKTLEEALADFAQTQLPDAASYGRTIYADGKYIGDIWCYCIDKNEEPGAMVSYCVFEPDYYGKGIATEALRLFIAEIVPKFNLKTLGAFTFASNIASIRVLEKNGFTKREEFEEDGILSCYLQVECTEGYKGVIK